MDSSYLTASLLCSRACGTSGDGDTSEASSDGRHGIPFPSSVVYSFLPSHRWPGRLPVSLWLARGLMEREAGCIPVAGEGSDHQNPIISSLERAGSGLGLACKRLEVRLPLRGGWRQSAVRSSRA